MLTTLEKLIKRGQRGTQKELAAFVGVTHVAVVGWANGTKTPTPKNAQKIGEFFRVTPEIRNGEWRFRTRGKGK